MGSNTRVYSQNALPQPIRESFHWQKFLATQSANGRGHDHARIPRPRTTWIANSSENADVHAHAYVKRMKFKLPQAYMYISDKRDDSS